MLHASEAFSMKSAFHFWGFLQKNSTKGGVEHEFSKGKTKEDSKTSGLNHPIHSGSSHIR